jgi:hypothetical protein
MTEGNDDAVYKDLSSNPVYVDYSWVVEKLSEVRSHIGRIGTIG